MAAVLANSWKSRPTTPPMKMSGMNTATREIVIETIVNPISPEPFIAAVTGSSPSSTCRVMFSSMTIASSTTKPTEIVSAISDTLSSEYPMMYIAAMVPRSDRGIATAGMNVARNVRRNPKTTITTSAQEISSVRKTSFDRGADGLRAVAEEEEMGRGRKVALQGGQERTHALHRLVQVVADLLVDIDHHGLVALHPGPLLHVLDTVDHRPDIADAHHGSVVGGERDRAELRGLDKLVVRIQRDRLAKAAERALGPVHRELTDPAANIFKAQAQGRDLSGIHLDANGGLLLAVVVDESHPGDARDFRGEEILDVVVDGRDRKRVGIHRDRHQQRVGGILLLERRRVREILRQVGCRRVDRGLHVHGCRVHASRELEFHCDRACAQRACRGDRNHARKGRERSLER